MGRKKVTDCVQIYQNWPRELDKEFHEEWEGHYRNRTEATMDAVRKLILELKHKRMTEAKEASC